MRVAPVGLVVREPFDLGCKVAALTHGHPSGWLAAGALAEMVAAVAGGHSIETAAQRALELCRVHQQGSEVPAALEQALLLVRQEPCRCGGARRCCGGVGVPEPQRNDRGIDTRGEQAHLPCRLAVQGRSSLFARVGPRRGPFGGRQGTDESLELPNALQGEHRRRARAHRHTQQIGRIDWDGSRRSVRQDDNQHQFALPPLEAHRLQQTRGQRMLSPCDSYFARQQLSNVLQSVAVPPGTGQSHVATVLAAQACAKGYKVRFFRTTELVTALIEARNEQSFLRLKSQLQRLDLLVTSNLPFESWTEVLGSERLTGATLDRLTHRCKIIETKGESLPAPRCQGSRTRRSGPRDQPVSTLMSPQSLSQSTAPLQSSSFSNHCAPLFDRCVCPFWTGVYSGALVHLWPAIRSRSEAGTYLVTLLASVLVGGQALSEARRSE